VTAPANCRGAAMSFYSFVRGRRVALVFLSRSIVGSGLGTEIDAHELVLGLNQGWPVPPGLDADLGQRIDILHHCGNGGYPIMEQLRSASGGVMA
jgi:hypothetical protein